MFFSCWQKL